MLNKYFRILFAVFAVAILFSCNNSRQADTSDIQLNLKFNRFENDLIRSDSVTIESVKELRRNYGDFFTVFCSQLIRMRMDNDTVLMYELNFFKNDTDIKVINKEVQKIYPDTKWLSDELTEVFKNYHYYFPKKIVPNVVTYISAFNYGNITMDSTLGIGLDFYLGAECPFYQGMNFPLYLQKKMDKNHIVINCIKSWYQKEFEETKVKNELLSQMIYYGKMFYFAQSLAPQMNDTLIIGYTKNQLAWCQKNEVNIWTALVENKLLFSTNMLQYNPFLAEGNTTNGFPEEAPSQLGRWIGWQMVRKYMDKNPDITLEQLCNQTDAQKILNDSGYKPGK